MRDNIINTVIVDDNKDFCNILKDFLSTQEDFHVSGVCHDGIEAIELISKNSPDLVVLDMIMPRLDGLGVLEKLNAADTQPRPVIVMLSAIGMDNITQRALSLGADYYLIKPFDMDQFINRVRQLVCINEHRAIIEYTASSDKTIEPKPGYSKTKNLDAQITGIMHEIGIPVHIKGFNFIRDAINLIITDTSYLGAITKRLYPELALKYNTTPPRVERAIRHAIEVAWTRGADSTFTQMYKRSAYNLKNKPTNSEFIALIADTLKLKNKESKIEPY